MGDAVMITLIATGFDDRAQVNDYRYRPGTRNAPPPQQQQQQRMPPQQGGYPQGGGYRTPQEPQRPQSTGPMQPDDDWGDMGGGSKLVDFIRRG